jgi:glucosamine--fructose-6-phosphate aminotransferase (isomerizing)
MNELEQQPDALRQMVAYYRQNTHLLGFFSDAKAHQWVLTGMGASYHAAWITSLHLKHLGLAATAVEATDLFNYAADPLGADSCLVYISQSGSSGEVPLLQERPADGSPLFALTNHLDSPLADCANRVLPMLGGDEEYIASKTYMNTLAILWLAARQVAGINDGSEWDTLLRVANRVEAIVDQAQALCRRLSDFLVMRSPLLFLGHGPHAATARQASMIMSEWSKVPAMNFGIGAFRHGFIEAVQPGVGAVIFSSPGRTQESARTLAHELTEYGVSVLRIENGRLFDAHEIDDTSQAEDEFLAPILDIVPLQLLTEHLARARGIEPGFRYISKVVRSL